GPGIVMLLRQVAAAKDSRCDGHRSLRQRGPGTPSTTACVRLPWEATTKARARSSLITIFSRSLGRGPNGMLPRVILGADAGVVVFDTGTIGCGRFWFFKDSAS